eukprot:1344120-Amphidinium_carterae.4
MLTVTVDDDVVSESSADKAYVDHRWKKKGQNTAVAASALARAGVLPKPLAPIKGPGWKPAHDAAVALPKAMPKRLGVVQAANVSPLALSAPLDELPQILNGLEDFVCTIVDHTHTLVLVTPCMLPPLTRIVSGVLA